MHESAGRTSPMPVAAPSDSQARSVPVLLPAFVERHLVDCRGIGERFACRGDRHALKSPARCAARRCADQCPLGYITPPRSTTPEHLVTDKAGATGFSQVERRQRVDVGRSAEARETLSSLKMSDCC